MNSYGEKKEERERERDRKKSRKVNLDLHIVNIAITCNDNI